MAALMRVSGLYHLIGRRGKLLIPVISFQSLAVEASEAWRIQSVIAEPLPPPVTTGIARQKR
jgi:hypothetical protein